MRQVDKLLNYDPTRFMAYDRVKGIEDGYIIVCPWCTKDIGTSQVHTYGELYNQLFEVQLWHNEVCPTALIEVKVHE